MRDKVWGGLVCRSHRFACKGQVRVVVRARSRKAVLESLAAHGLPVTLYCLKQYWCETGNKQETEAAVDPGVPYFVTGLYGESFESERALGMRP